MKLSPKATARIARADNWSLRAITGGSMFVAALGVWSTVARILIITRDPDVTVSGMQLENPSTPEFTAGASSIVSAQYESVTIVASDLSTAARGYLAAEAATSGLLIIGLSVVVAMLGMRLLAKRPFARSVTWASMAAAIITLAVGMTAPFLAGLARAEVVMSLGTDNVTAANNSSEGFSLFMTTVDLAPIGWAFALAMVAAAFQVGQRLQRETDGLV
ncbi:hypothetical protein AB0O95_03600 [Rhodoglobus sp. NPDC076762]